MLGQARTEAGIDRDQAYSGLAPRVLATVHPSSILRAPDEEARALAYEALGRNSAS